MKMNTRYSNYILALGAAAVMASCSGSHSYTNTIDVDTLPSIWPDYSETTIPCGIAPMNFNYTGNAYNWLILEIKGSVSGEISMEGKHVDIDIDEWHRITEANKGGQLNFKLSIISGSDRYDFKEFPIYVSGEPLGQYGLTYRLVEPGYVGFSKMGIYERNLSNFDEKAIFVTTEATNSCVNCHTPNRTNSSQATFHVRGDNGFTFVKNGDSCHAYNLKTDKTISGGVYPYWHPSGRYIAYSNNKTYQVFHTAHKNRIEVFDQNSDLMIFDVEKQEVILSPEVMRDTIAETFPAFSPDGNTLYYCQSVKPQHLMYLEDIRYCLMKADFDPGTGRVSHPEILLAIPGKSVTLPRPSYDGKYLMATIADYGTFPIWHHEADLIMIDLQNKDTLNVYPANGLNSTETESFHNWSANSKWVVFSSRRDGDGLYTRLYLSQVTDSGTFTKPFILPQKNPVRYYNDLFYSYNTPDFCDKPFDVSAIELRRIANSHERESVKAR